MKSPNAHADPNRGMCIESCCILVEELSHVIDTISRALKLAETLPTCLSNPRIYSKLQMCKNLSINTLGRFTALVNAVRNGIWGSDPDANINTLSNLGNGVVEIRNIVRELLEEPDTSVCRDIKESLEKMTETIDYLGLKLCILSLSLLSRLNHIQASQSGKIASSLASLLFASLLSIHQDNVKRALNECLGSSLYQG
uniref:Uncharacterized protein n=1 Tax=Ignisphaera aggregans TaxID=334771 RepID=A0A7C2ZNF1_9CREN